MFPSMMLYQSDAILEIIEGNFLIERAIYFIVSQLSIFSILG